MTHALISQRGDRGARRRSRSGDHDDAKSNVPAPGILPVAGLIAAPPMGMGQLVGGRGRTGAPKPSARALALLGRLPPVVMSRLRAQWGGLLTFVARMPEDAQLQLAQGLLDAHEARKPDAAVHGPEGQLIRATSGPIPERDLAEITGVLLGFAPPAPWMMNLAAMMQPGGAGAGEGRLDQLPGWLLTMFSVSSAPVGGRALEGAQRPMLALPPAPGSMSNAALGAPPRPLTMSPATPDPVPLPLADNRLSPASEEQKRVMQRRGEAESAGKQSAESHPKRKETLEAHFSARADATKVRSLAMKRKLTSIKKMIDGRASHLAKLKDPSVKPPVADRVKPLKDEAMKKVLQIEAVALRSPRTGTAAAEKSNQERQAALDGIASAYTRDLEIMRRQYLWELKVANGEAASGVLDGPDTTRDPEEAVGPDFTVAAARQLIEAHPPASGTASPLEWLGLIAASDLEAVGFDWNEQRHLTLATRAFEDARKRAEQAGEDRIRERLGRLRYDNTNTWEINPEIRYLNDVHEQNLGQNPSGRAAVVESLMKPGYANGAAGNRIPCVLNSRLHTHINNGSGGISFIYVVEPDFTVTACVYDYALSRVKGNQYAWVKGGDGYVSDAAIPASADYQAAQDAAAESSDSTGSKAGKGSQKRTKK